MDLISSWKMRFSGITTLPSSAITFNRSSSRSKFRLPFGKPPFSRTRNGSFATHARKRKSQSASESVPRQSIIEQLLDNDDEDEEERQVLFDEFDDELSTVDDDGEDYFEDEFIENETELVVGDGGGGGGIRLAGTWWDKEALAIAEAVCQSFDGDLGLYAFKTLSNSTIQVRIERLTNKSGSPDMEDIEAFSTTYRARLDEAELAKSIPESISLEVSSPGVERVVRIPQDLDRFKDRPMYVKYVSEAAETGLAALEGDGVFRLVSFDIEARCCTWALADVRVNREKAGKGRAMSKKQREWRLDTSFDSLRLVRLHSQC